jgi:hypothetical protein
VTKERDQALSRQGRVVSLVIALTAAFWVGAQVFGPQLGLPGEYAFLVDLAALAAFTWCLIVTYGMWRKRRD